MPDGKVDVFAVRFDGESGVAGYDPDRFKAMYDNADGRTWEEKVNAMRREQYAANRDEINAQKRAAYARRKGLPEGGGGGIVDTANAANKTIGQSTIENALKTGNTSEEICGVIIENHEELGQYTPQEMKTLLESLGYDVIPLSRGNLKNVPFSEGGGYKVLFGGDGVFQYHPDDNSHHDGAYWKVSNGTFGTKRYNLDGSEK